MFSYKIFKKSNSSKIVNIVKIADTLKESKYLDS